MSILNLEKMFSPKSVAFFGAGEKTGTIGATVTQNLLEGGFKGPVWLINPHHKLVAGKTCYHSVKDIPGIPDLAIIATPPESIPGIISELGEKGTKACVIITAGINEDRHLHTRMLDAARPYGIRIMGSNCFGLMLPGVDLNASFGHMTPRSGGLALVSQSGAVIATAIDWADDKNIGFSKIVSLGNMDDIDIGDTLDWLAMDRESSAIIMYLEQVTNPRKFMSAARAAARIKPIIVMKSGRHAEGARAALSHTGSMAGSDEIYDAAFRRAGLLRVTELAEMFDAAEILSHPLHVSGERLTIISNGGGAGVLAVDRLIDFGGMPAVLEVGTIEKLDKVLPKGWSRSNPVDIIGDAGADRYARVLEIIAQDKNTDAILVINCPTALASSTGVALTLSKKISLFSDSRKTVVAAWLGGSAARPGREILSSQNIPVYETPEDAIRGFSYLTNYSKLQEEIMRTPPAMPDEVAFDSIKARKIIQGALQTGKSSLDESEAKDVLSCYGIPVVPTVIARTLDDIRSIAATAQKQGGHSLAIKILSPHITHKSDFGGVALNVNPAHAADTASAMMKHIVSEYPDVVLTGFTVQPMVDKPKAHELIVGIKNDQTFGPVILFGQGGIGTEVVGDTAVDLVPLDRRLALDLIRRTKIYKLLQGYRDRPHADLDAISMVMVKLSLLAIDCPEIQELDINPLLADEDGVIALDARIVIKAIAKADDNMARLAIRPYPQHLEKNLILPRGETVLIRPIRPDDERYFKLFMEKTEPDDMLQRFFSPLHTLSHQFIARLTHIDYARAMGFVVLDVNKDEMIATAHLHADPDYTKAEYGLIVRSDKKSRGIGWVLLNYLIDYAKAENIHELWGTARTDNAVILKMCSELGFLLKMDKFDPSIINTTLKLFDTEKQSAGR